MSKWQPISKEDFLTLLDEQYSELSGVNKKKFDEYKIPVSTAKILRSEIAGPETVFVVARYEKSILYFDDVEYGFNISNVDKDALILTPGGSQNSLLEAIEEWF